jgi:uncharacterized membrane protein
VEETEDSMNPVNEWLNLLFRWLHVVAGVIWIGHLYFFNFVNAHFAKLLDGPTKKIVVPQLMPRALFWFRWGAAWTFISGWVLAALVYYLGGAMFEGDVEGNVGMAHGSVTVGLVLVFLYDVIQKSMKGSNASIAICLALVAAQYGLMEYGAKMSGRAIFIHIGMFFGTAMAMNVWMRIWPAQRKIITAIKDGTAPDADLVAMAGLRSRHNTFLSVPLLFLMVSNHFPGAYGVTAPMRAAVLAGFIAVGLGVTHWLYKKSAAVPGF